MTPVPTLTIRPVQPEDHAAIIALLASTLGYVDDDRHAALFDWKHCYNVFGASPAWVATDAATGTLAGVRIFLRWEFEHKGRIVRAVRAVDTATHRDYQGQGIFTKLTMHALDALAEDGVEYVFNTPNDRSRPGYLKMGWREVGRLPAHVRPLTLRGLTRMPRAQAPAAKWSDATDVGEPACEVLAAEREVLAALLTTVPRAHNGLRTRRTTEFLIWRYGFPMLNYRVVRAPAGLADGFAVLRIRRRGSAHETVICEVIAHGQDARLRRDVTHHVAREAKRESDYALCLGRAPGFVPLPRQGPILVCRSVGRPPSTDDHVEWQLTMGDIELF